MMFPSQEVELVGPDKFTDIPPRSILHPLEPKGAGTPFRECLASFFQRLADNHLVTPGDLFRGVIQPRMVARFGIDPHHLQHLLSNSSMNGVGRAAEAWANILANLTGQTDLESMTMVRFGKILPSGLMARKRKWCPICLFEDERESSSYGRLIWMIESVVACPKHGIQLQTDCGCNPKNLSHINACTIKNMPGVCNRCGKLLSHGASKYANASTTEIEEAKLVAELLLEEEIMKCDEPVAERISRFIKGAVTHFANGNYASFSRMIGVGKNVMHGYIHAKHIPLFFLIARMARICHCPISSILLGKNDFPLRELRTFENHSIKPKRKSSKFSEKRKEKIRRQLEIYLELPTPIPIKQIAETLKVSDKFLHRTFPALMSKIAPRYLAHCRIQSEIKFQERCELIRKAAETLCQIGVHPNIRSLRTYLKNPGFLFGMRTQAAVKTISMEVLEQSRSLPATANPPAA